MVTTLRDTRQGISISEYIRLAEVIGPAGSGKSTLVRALVSGCSGIELLSLPPVWNRQYYSFFCKNIIELLPILVRIWGKGDRNISRRELAWMAMLNGWSELLQNEKSHFQNVMLFDQGPIFLMAILQGFGPTALQCVEVGRWWERIYERWARVLDMLVYLDAPDEVLISRIRSREEDHLIKGSENQEFVDFLAVYRGIYEKVISKVVQNRPEICVLRMNTAIESVDELVSEIRIAVE